jgi:hypothetical protein
MSSPDLLRFYIEGHSLKIDVSLWLLALLLIAFLVVRWVFWNRKGLFHKYEIVKLNVQLGNVGSVELQPNIEDI